MKFMVQQIRTKLSDQEGEKLYAEFLNGIAVPRISKKSDSRVTSTVQITLGSIFNVDSRTRTRWYQAVRTS